MLTLVIGASASGKSAYAERLVFSLPGENPRIYLATMEPFGREAQERIERHRAMRRDRGFMTVECARNLQRAPLPMGSNVLLEDLGNLVANELFSPDVRGADEAYGAFGAYEAYMAYEAYEAEEAVVRRILGGVQWLRSTCAHLTIVTNEVFSGGQQYEGETLRYMRILARVNREIAGQADQVAEVICGIPVLVPRGVPSTCDSSEKSPSRISLKGAALASGMSEREGKGKGKGKEGGPMLFVTGPLCAGKQDYIMRTLGWDDAAFAANAVRDVQELAAQAVREQPAEDSNTIPAQDRLQERLRQLADALAKKQVVIATEVGGGIVPTDPVQRREREAAGRLACLLAERAQTVVRVNCGLPQILRSQKAQDLL